MSIITIVGAGMMGSAMAFPASDNGHSVRLVGTPLDRDIIDEAIKTGYHKTLKRNLPQNTKCYQIENLDEALQNCDLLIGGVSSFGVEWFGGEILPKIPKTIPVISITKGLHADEDGTLTAFPDYLLTKPGCDGLSLNAIGGPCISFELADRQNTVVAFCGRDIKILEYIKSLLETEYYHINLTTDILGIETVVAMKNAYALGVSLAIGMNEKINGENCPEKYNPQAGLFTQSTKEILGILEITGGHADKIIYGAGDLYVTVFGGRTRRIGTLLGRGLTYGEAAEILKGVTLESVAITKVVIEAIKKLEEKNKANVKDFPLLLHIYDMITKGETVNVPWKQFCETEDI